MVRGGHPGQLCRLGADCIRWSGQRHHHISHPLARLDTEVNGKHCFIPTKPLFSRLRPDICQKTATAGLRGSLSLFRRTELQDSK